MKPRNVTSELDGIPVEGEATIYKKKHAQVRLTAR